MPFEKIDINQMIEEERANDPEFRKIWDESREEYRLIGELIALRKAQNLSQSDLAKLSGKKQQVISRMEKHISSPSLRNYCNLLDKLGYQLQIVKKPFTA